MPTTARSRLPRLAVAAATLASLAAGLGGCDDTPTTAVVDNAFPASPSDGGGLAPRGTAVYKVWWITTLFASPVAPGASSEIERTVPGDDYVYALLAPGWSPSDQVSPPHLIVARSANKLAVSAHEALHIVVSDDTFIGDCAAGHPLSAADAQLVVERIFPGALTGAYDPATCTVSRPDGEVSDAGADAVTTDAGD